MKIIFLISAVISAMIGLYFYFYKGQIDKTALFLAISAMLHSSYVDMVKKDK